MPQYRITDSVTGKTVTVSGNAPPSPQDADQIFQQAGLRNQQQASSQQPKSLIDQIGSFLLPEGSAVAKTIGTALGLSAGGAQNTVNQASDQAHASATKLIQRAQTETDPAQKQKLLALAGSIDQGTSQASQSFTNSAAQAMPTANQNPIQQGMGATAEAGSYLVPFGEGTNIVSKAIVPGAVMGLLQGISKPNASPQSVAASAVGGSAGAGITHGLTGLLAPIMDKTGSALADAGAKTIRSQYNVTPSDAVGKQVLNTATELMQKYGLSKLDDVPAAAQVVTGSDGIVNQLKQSAITNAKPVNTGGVLQMARDALANEPLIANTTTAKNFMNVVKNGIYSAAGETPGGGDPSKIFKMIQDLEGQAADLRSGNSSKTEQSLSSVYKTVANDLKKRLFVDSGANAAIPNMQLTPEQYQQLHSISPRLAQEVASAKTVSDLRSIEAPFVRASQLAERSMNRTNGKPFDLGDTILAAGGMLHPAGLGLIGLKHYLSSNTGKSQVGGAMMKTGQALENNGGINAGYRALLDYIGGKTGSAIGGN